MTGIEVWLANVETLTVNNGADAQGSRRLPSQRFHAPRVLIGLALSSIKGLESSAWRFDPEQAGRLSLGLDSGASVLHYDVSQAGRTIAVAISTDGPVGLGLETLQRPVEFDSMSRAIRDSVFTERELDQLDALDTHERWPASQRCWAAKDARSKRRQAITGASVADDFDDSKDVDGARDDSGSDPADFSGARAVPWTRLEGRDLTVGGEPVHLALAARPGPAAEVRVIEFMIAPEDAAVDSSRTT